MTIRWSSVALARLAIALGVAAASGSTTPAAAEAKRVLTVDALKAMVTGLGYEATSDADSVGITVSGNKYDLTVELQISDISPVLYVYTHPGDGVAEAKLADVPALDLLKYNDNHPDFFALTHFKDGTVKVALIEEIEESAVSPKSLRTTIDRLAKAVADTDELWDPDQWSGTTIVAPKTLEAGQAQVEKIWEAMPLGVRRAVIVAKEAPMFGSYEPRADNVFKPDETILTYLEPIGYLWKRGDDGSYKFGVSVDLEVLKPDRTIVAGKKNFASLPIVDRSKIQELMLNLSLHLHDFDPGDYTLTYTLHDLGGPKTASVSLPFKVAK